MRLLDALKEHRDELVQAATDSPFIVFLCGPNMAGQKRSARLRKKLKKISKEMDLK
jgi:hypothetical protein